MRGRGRWLAAVFLALLAALTLGVCVGARPIGPVAAWRALCGGGDDAVRRILLHVRLPRALGALLAGCALSVSGAIVQCVMNNSLASPNVIGVNSGAGLCVLLAGALFPGAASLLPVAAFAGALAATLLVLALAACGSGSRMSVLLIGFAVNSLLGAGMNAVLIFAPDAYLGASQYLVGGFAAVTLAGLRFPAVYIGGGLCLAFALGGEMNVLALGEDAARSLGMPVRCQRLLLVCVSAVLAGAAVSFAGLVGFVGLVAPHSARLLVGGDNRLVLPVSACLGGVFALVCDVAARTLFAPYELPAGLLMSFVGAPLFVALLIKKGRSYA